MKEIGGYIELDKYMLPMLHENAIALNCARNCLGYLIKARCIKKIVIPKFLCSSVKSICDLEHIETKYYSIGIDFLPKNIRLNEDEWLYIVNYYGQLNNTILTEMFEKYKRIIVDNVQAYYQVAIPGIDTLYTCRKFFGVADGAFLYTNKLLDEELEQDKSYTRMRYLLGRYEASGFEFYQEYVENNKLLTKEPIKRMSKLTYNLLHGIDYNFIKQRRTENFEYFHKVFKDVNQLKLIIPKGAFMYPLFIDNGLKIRKKLCADKIYIPLLWPDVFDICMPSELEYKMAMNILPLPIDQRYDTSVMQYIIDKIQYYIRTVK